MRIYDAGFLSSLSGAREGGIAPVYFLWIEARDSSGDAAPVGLWSGHEDVTVTVEQPDASTVSRSYYGGAGLSVDGFQQVTDLTDNPITVTISQIADEAQELVRGLDVRMAYCEIHVTTMNGGVFSSNPQVEFVGIVDDAPISTPAAGGDGGITLSLRDEIITQLTALNPAKSSDAHQKRRSATDRFCEYAGIIASRNVQWYKG